VCATAKVCVSTKNELQINTGKNTTKTQRTKVKTALRLTRHADRWGGRLGQWVSKPLCGEKGREGGTVKGMRALFALWVEVSGGASADGSLNAAV